jgi:hypothetical protein
MSVRNSSHGVGFRGRLAIGAASFLATLLLLVPIVSAIGPGGSGALELDGANDYASGPDGVSYDVGTGPDDDFTLETMFKLQEDAEGGTRTLLHKNGAYALYILLDVDGEMDRVVFRVWTDPSAYVYISHDVSLGTDWHHLAAVFDNELTEDEDLLALYLDGEQVARSVASEWTPGIPDSASALNVGGYVGTNGFPGWLDEVRISDEVRYSEDSYEVPDSAFVPDAATNALYHFDEAEGATTFTDASGGGNTLTGANGAKATGSGADDGEDGGADDGANGGGGGTESALIELTATTTALPYGATAIFVASVTADSGSLEERSDLTLWKRPAGSTVWVPSTTMEWDIGSQSYLATSKVEGITDFQVRMRGDSFYSSAVSDVITVRSRAYVTRPFAPASVKAGRRFTVYGYLKPRQPVGAYPVRIYRYKLVAGKWKRYGYYGYVSFVRTGDYSGYSRYSRSMSLPSRGKWLLRAYALTRPDYVGTWSAGYDIVVVR